MDSSAVLCRFPTDIEKGCVYTQGSSHIWDCRVQPKSLLVKKFTSKQGVTLASSSSLKALDCNSFLALCQVTRNRLILLKMGREVKDWSKTWCEMTKQHYRELPHHHYVLFNGHKATTSYRRRKSQG